MIFVYVLFICLSISAMLWICAGCSQKQDVAVEEVPADPCEVAEIFAPAAYDIFFQARLEGAPKDYLYHVVTHGCNEANLYPEECMACLCPIIDEVYSWPLEDTPYEHDGSAVRK
jgi:hypothetical protein